MTKYNVIPIETLRQLLSYDSITGILTWREARAAVHVGDVAGTKTKKGYIRLDICEKAFMAHRVCWALHYGEWPADQIDHENTIKDDNRIGNLREANNSQNMQNRPVFKSNKLGLKGVCWHKRSKRWRAQIQVDKKKRFLGDFHSQEEAAEAYKTEAAKLHSEFHRAA